MDSEMEEIKSRILRMKAHWEDYKETKTPESAKTLQEIAFDAAKKVDGHLLKAGGDRAAGAEKDENAPRATDYEGAIHDIKAPLTEIHIGAGALKDGFGFEGLEEMLDGAFGVLDDVFEHYKEPFNPVELDLHDLLKESVPQQSGIDLRLELDGLPQTAEVDGNRFRSMMRNIVNNAYDNLRENKVENPFVHITGERENGYFVLHIRDNGTGIPENLEGGKMFTKYETGRKETGGTGVGGHLIKEAVGLHNGEVWHEPAGPGTVFHVRIPLKHELKE